MNRAKDFFVALIALMVLFIACIIFDAFFAAIVWVVLLVFQSARAVDISKWAFIGALIVQAIFLLPTIIHMFDKGGEEVGS